MKLSKFIAAILIVLPIITTAAQMKPYDGITPSLELKDTTGKSHQLAGYSGQVVLVQFWATYCTPCRKEMPSMNNLIKKMDGKLTILAVNMGEQASEVTSFMKEVGVDFPVLMDESGETLGEWKVFAAPSNFIVDKTGKIRYTLFGGVEWDSDEIVELLEQLAQE